MIHIHPFLIVAQNGDYEFELIKREFIDKPDNSYSFYNLEGKLIGYVSPTNKIDTLPLLNLPFPIENRSFSPLVKSKMRVENNNIGSVEFVNLGNAVFIENMGSTLSGGFLSLSRGHIPDVYKDSKYVAAYYKSGNIKYAKGPFNKIREPIAYSLAGETYMGGTFENKTSHKQFIVKLNSEGEVEWEKEINESSSCFEFIDIKVSNEGDRVAILGDLYFDCKKDANGKREFATSTVTKLKRVLRIFSSNGDLENQLDIFYWINSKKISFFGKNKIVFIDQNRVTILNLEGDNNFVKYTYRFETLKGNIAVSDDGQLFAFISKKTNELTLVKVLPETTNIDSGELGKYKILTTIMLDKSLLDSVYNFIQFNDNNTIEVISQFERSLFSYKK